MLRVNGWPLRLLLWKLKMRLKRKTSGQKICKVMWILKAENLQNTREHHAVKTTVASLRKRKANAGGPRRKELVAIRSLMSWCRRTGIRRDLVFQSSWFLLIATGCRPEELHTINIKYTPLKLSVKWNGRKNNATSSAAYFDFPYTWSACPPQHIAAFLSKCRRLVQGLTSPAVLTVGWPSSMAVSA